MSSEQAIHAAWIRRMYVKGAGVHQIMTLTSFTYDEVQAAIAGIDVVGGFLRRFAVRVSS